MKGVIFWMVDQLQLVSCNLHHRFAQCNNFILFAAICTMVDVMYGYRVGGCAQSPHFLHPKSACLVYGVELAL